MTTYVIFAQMGNEEDYTWEEVDRTTSLKEAVEAFKQGARVYEENAYNFTIDRSDEMMAEIAIDELPF